MTKAKMRQRLTLPKTRVPLAVFVAAVVASVVVAAGRMHDAVCLV